MRKYISYKNIITSIFMMILGTLVTISTMLNQKNSKFYIDVPQVKNGILVIISIALCLVFINLFLRNNDFNYEICSNRKALLSFASIITIYILIIYIFTYKVNANMNSLMTLAIQIFLVCCVLIMYLFGLKFNNFKWTVTFKELLIFITAVLILLCPRLIFQGKSALKYYSICNGNNLAYLYYSLRAFVYPAFNEEVIYRGLLITGLKGYGFSNWKINIIQSVIFGIVHFGVYKGLGLISLVLMSSQICLGYIIGIIYFKTKSLTPCIIFHALIDIV